MEIHGGRAPALVGAAKLEPVLALYAHLEARRPGRALGVGGELHHPASLRRWHARRADIATPRRPRRRVPRARGVSFREDAPIRGTLSPMRAFSAAAVLGLVCGCSCSEPPAGCTSSRECPAPQSCVDRRCVDPLDAAVADASSPTFDAPSMPLDANCISSVCGAEDCYDGIDRDCDGMVDEGCSCAPGTTARCLPGRGAPTVALCSWGEMTCVGAGEFGTWGPCAGASSADAGSEDGGTAPYGCRRIGIMGAPGANPSSNFQAWLEMQGAIATRFHASAAAGTLQRAELETYDLVVVDWLQRVYAIEEAATLAEWVSDGGALMVMTGHDSGATADRHVSLLAALGPTFDLAAGPRNGPAMLLPHATTATADGAGTLPPITFYGGLRTIVPAALSADVVPMAVIGGETVGVAGPIGMGRVLLFGDEWIEFDSEWSTMPPILQFWLNTVTWLSPEMPVLPECPAP
jgi:hypothetical protein